MAKSKAKQARKVVKALGGGRKVSKGVGNIVSGASKLRKGKGGAKIIKGARQVGTSKTAQAVKKVYKSTKKGGARAGAVAGARLAYDALQKKKVNVV